MNAVNPRVLAGIVILTAAAGVTVARLQSVPERITPMGHAILTRDDPAPEFAGLTGWLNGSPTTLKALRGKVVLIDFWTYSCINCVRTFPELRALKERYGSNGLEIIGIHAPEFDFERLSVNVARAVVDKNVTWRVAQDNQMRTWDRYRNRFWPHVYLIDKQGRIRFDYIGEGGGKRIEQAVRELLGIDDEQARIDHDGIEGPSDGITPEIYLGYERGTQFFAGTYRRDKPQTYAVPRDLAEPGFALSGRWRADREAVVTLEAGARIELGFTARTVFVVGGSPAAVQVLLDGKPYKTLDLGGKDIYEVVRLASVESHHLTLVLPEGAAFYSFTFG